MPLPWPEPPAAAALRDGAAKTAHPPLTGRGGGGGLRTMSFDVPPRCLGRCDYSSPTSARSRYRICYQNEKSLTICHALTECSAHMLFQHFAEGIRCRSTADCCAPMSRQGSSACAQLIQIRRNKSTNMCSRMPGAARPRCHWGGLPLCGWAPCRHGGKKSPDVEINVQVVNYNQPRDSTSSSLSLDLSSNMCDFWTKYKSPFTET